MLTMLLLISTCALLLASIKVNSRLKQELHTKTEQLSKTLNAYKLVMVRMSELELKDALLPSSTKKPTRRKTSGQLSIFENKDEQFTKIQSEKLKARPRISSSSRK